MGNQTKVELTVERRNEHQCLVSRMMCQNLCDFFFWDSTEGYYDLYRLNLTAIQPKETFFSTNDKFHSTRTRIMKKLP